MISITTDRSLLDIPMICEYLRKTYWADKRSASTIIKSIENSICFGMYLDGIQIGFARIVTDESVFSYLMDVFVIEEHNRKGYGKKLISTFYNHPRLVTVVNHYLMTKDAQDIYRRFGFTEHEHPSRFMKRV